MPYDTFIIEINVEPAFAADPKQTYKRLNFDGNIEYDAELKSMLANIPNAEDFPVEIGGDSEEVCDHIHNLFIEQKQPCKHFIPVYAITDTRSGTGKGFEKNVDKTFYGIIPNTVVGIIEGGYGSIALCVDCIKEKL